MYDNLDQPAPLGLQIRRLREGRRWTLAELARRAETSAPTLHRYENGWDRFEVATLRKIAAALGSRLVIRLVPGSGTRPDERRWSWDSLAQLLAPLLWDTDLGAAQGHPEWLLGRVLVFGNREQVAAARSYFGDETIRRTIERRDIDARTRNYWMLILSEARDAPQGP